jgi:signal peptidase I
MRGSAPRSAAGTWIGAQAPGSPNGPFIQIGTNEQTFVPAAAAKPNLDYIAFWSDTARDFHPQPLFPVNPGDDIFASLTLARGRWTLAIVDKASGAEAHFATREDANASFNEAQWMQEDIRDTTAKRPFPYPRLTAVAFHRLTVNSVPPSYSDLYSQWMSENGSSLAPIALHDDSFIVRRATVSAIGARYLHLVLSTDAMIDPLISDIDHWTTHTPRSQINSERAEVAAAFRNGTRLFAGARWPRPVGGLIHSLTHKNHALVDLLDASPFASGLRSWLAAWTRDEVAAADATHLVRRALHLPELTPVPQTARSDASHLRPYRVPSGAMEPTLHIGQVVYTSPGRYTAHIGDVVIFHPPRGATEGNGDGTCGGVTNSDELCPRPSGGPAGDEWIKRVVATGGDSIALVDGHVILSGKRQNEPFATFQACLEDPACMYTKPITIPNGYVFLLGDNRGESDDSRFWGPVPTSWVVGRAETCSSSLSTCSDLTR